MKNNTNEFDSNEYASMYHELSEIKHYAETALKSLNNKSLSEVRGMLEGIIEKTKIHVNEIDNKRF